MHPGRRRAEKMILQRQVTLQKAERFYHTVVVIERRPGVMTAQPGGGSERRVYPSAFSRDKGQ